MVPWPAAPSASAMATISSADAWVPGTTWPLLSTVAVEAGGREAERTVGERLPGEFGHRGHVLGGGVVVAALAHHVVAQRHVRHLGADVDAVGRVDGDRGTRRSSPSPTGCPRAARCRGCPRRSPSATRVRPRCRAAPGAKPTPQLPMTTVVTPCQHDGVTCLSQHTCPSKWVWMSTKPGVSSRPSASTVRVAAWPASRPTSVIRPPDTATSPVKPGRPVPSTMNALVMSRSCMETPE